MTRRDAAYVILFVLGLISFYAVRFISEGAGWKLTSEHFGGAPGVVGFFMLSFGVYILVLLIAATILVAMSQPDWRLLIMLASTFLAYATLVMSYWPLILPLLLVSGLLNAVFGVWWFAFLRGRQKPSLSDGMVSAASGDLTSFEPGQMVLTPWGRGRLIATRPGDKAIVTLDTGGTLACDMASIQRE